MDWMVVNMSKTLVYPTGFSRCVTGPTESLVTDLKRPRSVVAQRPDRQVEILHVDWMTDMEPNMPWSRRRNFILYFNSLYGDFWSWLKQQVVTNDYIYDVNLDFLIDTVRFLLTGHRHMAVQNWRDLIKEFPAPELGAANADRWEYFKQETGLDENHIKTNYIGMWCRHESGFEDLIHTTQIIFGRPVSPVRD